MAERRITCHNCPTFDREDNRCRCGKTNPKKKHVAMTIAELLGPEALCLHSPHREPLLLRMHAPRKRFAWDGHVPASPYAPVDVEILDD